MSSPMSPLEVPGIVSSRAVASLWYSDDSCLKKPFFVSKAFFQFLNPVSVNEASLFADEIIL